MNCISYLFIDLVFDLVWGCCFVEFVWFFVVDCCYFEFYNCFFLKIYYSEVGVFDWEVVYRNLVVFFVFFFYNIVCKILDDYEYESDKKKMLKNFGNIFFFS